MRALAASLLALTLIACEDARRPGGTVTPSTRDGGVAGQDAGGGTGRDAEGAPDASGGLPDASGGFPDASSGFPDASGGFPDASSGFPDASSGFPDAAMGPPDSGAPPVETTISQIRAGAFPVGAPVIVRDVVVTAIHDEVMRNDTIWVQDPRLGGRNAGVRVYVRGAHSAFRDARVDVSGVVADYFGDAEINNATVTNLGGTGSITPVALTVAEAMAEEREGVLVRLTDVFNVTNPYSCSLDDPMCADARLWEVNGPGGIIVYDFAFEGVEWEARAGVTDITGVMTWRYNHRRIMPRTDADLAF